MLQNFSAPMSAPKPAYTRGAQLVWQGEVFGVCMRGVKGTGWVLLWTASRGVPRSASIMQHPHTHLLLPLHRRVNTLEL